MARPGMGRADLGPWVPSWDSGDARDAGGARVITKKISKAKD